MWLSEYPNLLTFYPLLAYRRAIMCRRAVRVKSQLKSHKRFANAFMTYCSLVDNARLYSTNALEGPPKVILQALYSTILLNSCDLSFNNIYPMSY